MCIKVTQDQALQDGRRARVDCPVPMWRQGRALLVDTMIGAAGASGAVLLSADGEAPLVRGEVPAYVLPVLQATLPRSLPAGHGEPDGVELLCSADTGSWWPLSAVAQRLRLRRMLLMVLRESGQPVAWVFLIEGVAPGTSRRATLHAAGAALLSHARMEAQGRATALQLRRLEDVAYAGGEWLWETDAAHRYTWVLRDTPCQPADDARLRVGQPVPQAQVVDWLGEPVEPASSLRDVMDRHRPIVRMVVSEHDGLSDRFVSRSAIPIIDADGGFLGYRGSARDVTQSIQAKAEVWRREEQAKQSSRAKSVLVSKMGHELKTPLNAIVGLAQLIRMKRLPDTNGAPIDLWIDQIARTGWHMADVIEMLLELGRSTSDSLRVGSQSVEVVDVLDEAMRIVEHDALRRGIAITVTGDIGSRVHADRRAVRQVFVNLLSNAIKYNTERGRVSLAIRDGEQVRITVRDTGPGLSAEQRARLFQPFDRLGAEHSGVEGHGLGLLICRELLVAMDGSIEVDGAAGEGCAFTVVLPASVGIEHLWSPMTPHTS